MYVPGETFDHASAPDLPFDIRETIFREAGRNLAELHSIRQLGEVGDLMGRGGKVSVLDTPDLPSYDVFHDWLLDSYEETLDQLLEAGGYFQEPAEDPNRIDDLIPKIRDYFGETVPELPPPESLRYCHKDYRYGNLVVDPETGETSAVFDWANLMSAPPGFSLAIAESKLLKPDPDTDADASTGQAGVLNQACAIANDAAVWSHDSDFDQQDVVETYATSDVINSFDTL